MNILVQTRAWTSLTARLRVLLLNLLPRRVHTLPVATMGQPVAVSPATPSDPAPRPLIASARMIEARRADVPTVAPRRADLAAVFGLSASRANPETPLVTGAMTNKAHAAENDTPVNRTPASPVMPEKLQELEALDRELATLCALGSQLNEPAAQAAHFKVSGVEDLEVIKGIGPKIAGILRAAGIQTFADLADCTENELRLMLREGGAPFRLANPASWIRQANLASLNQWQELLELQARRPKRGHQTP